MPQLYRMINRVRSVAKICPTCNGKKSRNSFQCWDCYVDELRANIILSNPNKDRNDDIYSKRTKGITLRSLAKLFKISHERIRQICRRYAKYEVKA
jgi:ribosome-interacting GTPase 1